MSNVIAFKPAPRAVVQQERFNALVHCFASERRDKDDVFWMKENAELLNIMVATNATVDVGALEPFVSFYQNAEQRLEFLPQYYRFLLSMILDLEELGMPGDMGERVVRLAYDMDLVGAELSDLQRAEAQRLMKRRGLDPIKDSGLNDRLSSFANRVSTFALPNKKASYELTHIAFYLSEYGRISSQFPKEAIQSLHFAGLMSFIEQNVDLLAEICVALVYSGETPPQAWTTWLEMQTENFELTAGDAVSCSDDYHSYFVCNWHAGVVGRKTFCDPVTYGRMRFDRLKTGNTPLREMSHLMMQMDGARSGDWDVMRSQMAPALSPQALDVIDAAANSSDHFDAFFEGFARAGRA